MRIRIWNSFASNNSGSYTLVGTFADSARAREVAAELEQVMKEHDAWVMARQAASAADVVTESPLRAFAERHGLSTDRGAGENDDWPEHSETTCPAVAAGGHQILLHHAYTITLPPLLGEYLYRRGGRVDAELDHAHSVLVTTIEVWWDWKLRERHPELAAALEAELCKPGGVFARCHDPKRQPVLARGGGFHSAPLTVHAVFLDLVAGFAEVAAEAARSGGLARVRVTESTAWGDPLRPFRKQ